MLDGDGGHMFLQNVGCNSTDYTASHPRRRCSSYPDFLVIIFQSEYSVTGYDCLLPNPYLLISFNTIYSGNSI
jgi:hypothetical protein